MLFGARAATAQIAQGTARLQGIARTQRESLTIAAVPPTPGQVHAVSPGVVFGIGWSVDAGSHLVAVHNFGVSTNLLGAAAGGLADAIGVETLKDYLAENLAVGTAIPGGGRAQISGNVQLGLGELRFHGRPIWPVLSAAQFDTADRRLPRPLARNDTTTGRWTALSFAVGVTFWSGKALQQRIEARKLVPIVTVGITFPYYFPGDPFAAFAGIITAKTRRYVRDGSVRFSIGLGIPLLRAKPE